MSSWDLTDVTNEVCNEVSTSFIKHQEDISMNFDQINITIVHASNMTTTLLNQTDLTNIHPTAKTNSEEKGIVDPDTQGKDYIYQVAELIININR